MGLVGILSALVDLDHEVKLENNGFEMGGILSSYDYSRLLERYSNGEMKKNISSRIANIQIEIIYLWMDHNSCLREDKEYRAMAKNVEERIKKYEKRLEELKMKFNSMDRNSFMD